MDKGKIKEEILKKVESETSKFFPVKSLQKMGFKRYHCIKCGRAFWSVVERDLCGDVDCIGNYTFMDESITKEKLNYKEAWETFAKIFKKFGHTEIKRYPVVARWRDDIFFVEAAIDDFAPYVIKGLSDPPANPLIIPQICLRFNDIKNVGMTGRHLTSFIMAEEAAFNTKKKKTYFDKEAIIYIYEFLIKGLKIPKEKLTFIEDAWVGAGYAGNSLEYFAGGLELGNQVYMRYSIDENDRLVDLENKTIDMGAGLERWVWVSRRTPTIYESAFPLVINFLKNKTGIDYSDDLVRKIYKYLGKIDFESTDKKEAIKYASERIGIKEDELNKIVDNISAIYKIADYTRTLLVAIHDGALPSNVGGGYNLREILRIAQNLIDIHGWKFSLNDVIEVHKREFGAWFTELNDFDISNVINKEVERYHEFKARNLEKIREIIEKGSIDEKEMKLLYESYGIAPEDILMEAEAENKKVVVPDVRLEIIKENKSVKKIDTGNIPPTKQMFYNKELTKTNAKIIKKLDDKTIVLDRTIFYPEMGGQKSDRGKIDGIDVIDVQKADDVILHHLASPINKKEGEKVVLIVDNERRSILRRQHTATHIINRAARRILGGFVNQYGAEKDIEKSHLDITYFDKIPEDIVRKIEQEANEIVAKDLSVTTEILTKTEAEKRYGMEIYQGGVVPSAKVRIVKIDDYDVEACGGLHCESTGQVGFIKIFGTERIQDGVVRIEFSAFPSSLKYVENLETSINNLSSEWGVKKQDVEKTALKFFELSKKYKNLYVKSETERIRGILETGKDRVEIDTDLETNQIINILSQLKGKIKEVIIRTGETVIIMPANKQNEEKMGQIYEKIINRGWFMIAYGKK